MQTGSDQLAQQQQIMEAKGFYKGIIDGIWGPATIAAKQKWERSGTFSPAIPNNGMPLADRGPYPRGVYRSGGGLLTCAELEVKKMQAKAEPMSKSAPLPDVPSTVANNPGTEE